MIWALEGRGVGWVGRRGRKNIVSGSNRMSKSSKMEESWHEMKVTASDGIHEAVSRGKIFGDTDTASGLL